MRRYVIPAAAFLFSACGALMLRDPVSTGVASEVAQSERMTLESRTRSSLAALERSVNDYIQAKGEVPQRLESLVPEYLAEIPEVVTGVRGHKDTSAVRYYSEEVISDGRINGALIEDSGGWGYVHSAEQVILFVDCTHKSMDGTLWFRVRGVY